MVKTSSVLGCIDPYISSYIISKFYFLLVSLTVIFYDMFHNSLSHPQNGIQVLLCCYLWLHLVSFINLHLLIILSKRVFLYLLFSGETVIYMLKMKFKNNVRRNFKIFVMKNKFQMVHCKIPVKFLVLTEFHLGKVNLELNT